MIYHCCNQLRRNAVKGTSLNGIDYLEVIDKEAPTEAERQRKLELHFINAIVGPAPTPDNIRIEGGERIKDIRVTKVTPGAGMLTVEVDKRGDFSVYTLRLVQDAEHSHPPAGYDPMLATVDFSFKVECESEFDCAIDCFCPPKMLDEPEIDYLAKDYASFRRLMLDRMALLAPAWKERSPADLGITLVELLAYVGDHLSYQQDAIATEAYLDTARRRVSVRRHAMLVDYLMHDGCNARTWVQVKVTSDVVPLPSGDPVLPKGTAVLTRIFEQPVLLEDKAELKRKAQAVFETMHDVKGLYTAHNKISFYTWSDRECCLPLGTMKATLVGNLPHLKAGDVLIFEEILGPQTGVAGDADLQHRHPVRLEEVRNQDAGGLPLTDPLTGQQITEIKWRSDDALPFPLCISAMTDDGRYIEDVSIALGNIVLADHGMTLHAAELLAPVPEVALYEAATSSCDRCEAHLRRPIPPRYRPKLLQGPLTHTGAYDPVASAWAAMRWKMEGVKPSIRLKSQLGPDQKDWVAECDLLDNHAYDSVFVVEIENDGSAYLRFGDDVHGARPKPQTEFKATYRVGNGPAGNIGAEALVHIVSTLTEIVAVRNPLPAGGGVKPESIEEVLQRAPSAFRTQERAVTPQDYADKVTLNPQVQRGAATFRWTGSWHTVFLTVDRLGSRDVDEDFEKKIRDEIERYRMAGYDLEVDGPRFVPLEIEMHVCIKPEYFRSQLKTVLLQLYSNRVRPDGQLGLFHPDRLTFGQSVYLSPLYAAAQSVAGVDSVVITLFQRKYEPDPKPLDEGVLEFGPLEIARLDSNPNYPERGVFRLKLEGGR